MRPEFGFCFGLGRLLRLDRNRRYSEICHDRVSACGSLGFGLGFGVQLFSKLKGALLRCRERVLKPCHFGNQGFMVSHKRGVLRAQGVERAKVSPGGSQSVERVVQCGWSVHSQMPDLTSKAPLPALASRGTQNQNMKH